MTDEPVKRRLAAILAADVVGYSRLMGEDETGTRARFNDLLDDAVGPGIEKHRGRLVKTMGDGFLVEFASVVDAVQCAADIQAGVAVKQSAEPDGRKMLLRVGIHLGDVIVEGDDIHGDGVNIAARLEGLAEPGGICVSDMVYAGVRNKLAIDFADLGDQSLRNIAEPVQVFRIVPNRPAVEGSTDTDALFRRPAVAVLPFENIGGDPEQEYFADGLTEDIITALSLWRSFPVIARNSAFAYKGTSPDIRKVGEELGARYVVEGSVRKASNRVRVTAQLINAETGHHVWAERFDHNLEDIFTLQDELTERIAATVAPEIERSVRTVSLASHSPDPDAWDYFQRGMAHQYEYTKESHERARELFQQAIQIDPRFARAYAALAFTYLNENLLGYARSVEDNQKFGLDYASRAVELDNTDPFAHWILAIGYGQIRQFERARLELETALELNPLHNRSINSMGNVLSLLGQPERGITFFEKGFRLSPRDPSNHLYYAFMARAQYGARRYDDAAEWANRSIHLKSDSPEPYFVLAASLGQLGRIEEGQNALKTCEDHTKATRYIVSYADETHSAHFLEGLRKVGWEG